MAQEHATLRPTPTPSRDSAFFWNGLKQNRLLAQACGECGRLRHPPRPMCPFCQSLEKEEVELSGRGRVHCWIQPVHPPLPMFEAGLLVALIELDEGIRLLSNVCGVTAAEMDNEMPVEVFFIEVGQDGEKLHQFRPAPELDND